MIPLIDLHCHLDGSITVEIAKKLASLQNIKLPSENDEELLKLLSVSETCRDLNEFLKCFSLPCALMQTKDGITEAVRLVSENIRDTGCVYLEIRFAPQLHLEKGLTQKEVIEAAVKGLDVKGIHTNLILCMMRGNGNEKQNLETIQLAEQFLVQDHGVVALDLAGAEAIFKTGDYSREFELIREKNIPYTIHAGEADGWESVKDALSYGTKRVGHGVRAIENPQLVEQMIKDQITFEFCPTSNFLTKVIDRKNIQLKLKELLSRGAKFTLNTDDMAICRTTLPKEVQIVKNEFGLSDYEVKQLELNAIDAAFTTQEVKTGLRKLFL